MAGRGSMVGAALAVAVLLTGVAVTIGACSPGAGGDAGPVSTASAAATEPSRPTTSAASTAPAAVAEPGISAEPGASSTTVDTPTQTSIFTTTTGDPRQDVTITIVYDNTAAQAGTAADWGFSCLVEGLRETVLFDTGAKGDVLLANMEALGVRAGDIDVVVLSHEHKDHTGGLAAILDATSGVRVYYPAQFSQTIVQKVEGAGATPVPVDGPALIGPGLAVTEPMGSPAELALVVTTAEGAVVITGCAHPGVVQMAAAAVEQAGGPVFAVMGGFHLGSASADQVERTIKGLKALGVERCGPAHCTGEAATARMREAFGDGFIPMGVGVSVVFLRAISADI
ncbi:MAG: MBL fold metallo-hydrolase [Thermoleophilia bacterium]|nr:MBL fold metallo-hydrolase [Thermoleophilia bacterium]